MQVCLRTLWQSDYRLLCDNGCREWTDDNARSSDCNNGESASQAVIASRDFMDSPEGRRVREALFNDGDVKVAGVLVCSQFTSSANFVVDTKCCCQLPIPYKT